MDMLQWILLVFAAGFIGYFGKYLGKILLEKMGKTGGAKDLGEKTAGGSPPPPDPKIEKKRLKLEKKRLKGMKDD